MRPEEAVPASPAPAQGPGQPRVPTLASAVSPLHLFPHLHRASGFASVHHVAPVETPFILSTVSAQGSRSPSGGTQSSRPPTEVLCKPEQTVRKAIPTPNTLTLPTFCYLNNRKPTDVHQNALSTVGGLCLGPEGGHSSHICLASISEGYAPELKEIRGKQGLREPGTPDPLTRCSYG